MQKSSGSFGAKRKWAINSSALLWYHKIWAALATGGSARLATTLRCCIDMARAGATTVCSRSPKMMRLISRLEVCFILNELLLQMLAGKFQGHKLMMIARPARRRQRIVRDSIVTGVAGQIIAPFFSGCSDFAAAVKVEAKLQAARMKAAAPVERLFAAKIVPLHAQDLLVEISIKLTPAVALLRSRPRRSVECIGGHWRESYR